MATNTPLTGDITVDQHGIKRDKNGRWLERPANGAPKITTANAREMQEKRWRIARQEAASRITREAAAIDPSVTTPAGAWGLVVSKQYTTLMDSDKPRFDDVHRLGQIIGALPGDMDKQQAQTQTIQHVHSLDPSQAAQIAALLADMSGQLTNIISNDDTVDAHIEQALGTGTRGTDETGSADDGAGE